MFAISYSRQDHEQRFAAPLFMCCRLISTQPKRRWPTALLRWSWKRS